MGLKDKVLLVYCDNEETLERLHASIDPVHEHTLYSKDPKDVMFRVSNQVFSAVIFAHTEDLQDPKGIYGWAKKNKDYADVPWIFLGEDFTGYSEATKDSPLKKLPLPEKWKTKELFAALDELFPHTGKAKAKFDPATVNPIIAACTKSLVNKSKIKLNRETPFIIEDGKPAKFGGDVSIRLLVETDQFKSSILLSFKNEFALELNKAIKGNEKTSIDTEVTTTLKSLGIDVFNRIEEGLNSLNIESKNTGIQIHEKLGLDQRHDLFGIQLCVPFQSEKGPLSIECVVAPRSNAK